MIAASALPARSRDGRFSGDLPPDQAREIVRRLRAGESYNVISAAVGLSRRVGRRQCAAVAKLIGLPTEQERYSLDEQEVLRRVQAGEDDAAIAAALGRTANSVAIIRRKHGLRRFRQLRLSEAENGEIERRLLAGESTRTIAAAVGCEQADVARRRKLIVGRITTDLPPCTCGKPKGHGGRCNLIVDPALIRARLLAGNTAAAIAREFGRTAQSFKPKYVDPVIEQLTAEGHRCGCGRPFGHQAACPTTVAAQRRSIDQKQRDRAAELVRQGASVAAIATDLGIAYSATQKLVTDVRARLAAAGVRCPCGAPVDHRWSCSARNADAGGRTAFRFASAAAMSMSLDVRRRISKLGRDGWPVKGIMERTGETEWRVNQLLDELAVAGRLPDCCRGCDRPYRHKGVCSKPKTCRCGRPRKHRGACRRPDGRRNVPLTRLSREQQDQIKRRVRNRASVRSIARDLGISYSAVQRVVTRMREGSHYALEPCACGRPAGHPGGCIVNTPGALGKRYTSRIEAGVRAGRTALQMADELKLHVLTVLKHSGPIRDRLFAEGVTCACGRPPNHPYWCSARWDAHEMPRGRRPFAEAKERQATEALLRGDVVADIARAIGVGTDSIWKLRRSLSEEQRAERSRAVRARIARGVGLSGEDLLVRVEAAVPKWVDKAVRDDVVGELHLALLEGRLELEQLASAVKSFVKRGLNEWQSIYGPRSLDAQISQDGRLTLGDLIEDDSATSAIDELTIGGDR